jgi:hypothetical protein
MVLLCGSVCILSCLWTRNNYSLALYLFHDEQRIWYWIIAFLVTRCYRSAALLLVCLVPISSRYGGGVGRHPGTMMMVAKKGNQCCSLGETEWGVWSFFSPSSLFSLVGICVHFKELGLPSQIHLLFVVLCLFGWWRNNLQNQDRSLKAICWGACPCRAFVILSRRKGEVGPWQSWICFPVIQMLIHEPEPSHDCKTLLTCKVPASSSGLSLNFLLTSLNAQPLWGSCSSDGTWGLAC